MKKFRFENVLVSFSTMLNKPEKAQYGRNFKIRIPIDSPELEKMKNHYKEVNDKAKVHFGEMVGKKLKNADMQVFDESPYAEGFVELGFNVAFMRDKEVKQDDGTVVKEKVEVLNPIYKDNPNWCFKRDNNGQKTYETENGKQWRPLSTNLINIDISLVAKYDKKNNRPTISFKAEEVEIISSDFGGKFKEPDVGYFTLDDEDGDTTNVKKSTKTEKDTETFSADDLEALDI